MSRELYYEYIKRAESEIVFLPDKPEETPDNTIKTLLLLATGKALSVESAMECEIGELTSDEKFLFKTFFKKRASGIPLSHITGYQRFMGIDFKVSSAALIPRKETEILGKAAIDLISKSKDVEKLNVIDICTGMGNLALSIAIYCKNTMVYGADLSSDAIILAKENASILGLTNRVEFYTGDLFEPLKTKKLEYKVDFIICNPPYISRQKVEQMPDEIKKFEPREAFDGGSFGISIVQRVINEAQPFLKKNGWLCFEVGLGQGDFFLNKLNKIYSEVVQIPDINGKTRVLMARY